MLVDGTAKQAIKKKNKERKKKDCHQKVYLYSIYTMAHKRSIKGPTF